MTFRRGRCMNGRAGTGASINLRRCCSRTSEVFCWPCCSVIFKLLDLNLKAAFNLIDGPEKLLTVHADHQASDMRASCERRDEWLSALVKGDPAPVNTNSEKILIYEQVHCISILYLDTSGWRASLGTRSHVGCFRVASRRDKTLDR